MKAFSHNILFVSFFLCLAFAGKSQHKTPGSIGKLKFGPPDTSLPVLKPGFYLVSKMKTKNTVYRKFYVALDEDPTGGKQFYHLITTDFVDFGNVDSIYLEKEMAPYEKYYRINLILNNTGRIQFRNMTGKCKTLSNAEQYDGLLIGTVINNTLIQVVHAHEPMDTNTVSISGAGFDEETVNDLKKSLKKERASKTTANSILFK